MNSKKLITLVLVAQVTIAGAIAGSNERGIDLYRAELYDAAKIFFLQQTNQSAEEQAENYYYLGQIYHALQKEDSVAYYYAKAKEADANHPLGYIGEGKLALLKGDLKAADASFKTALGLAKKDPSVQTSIAEAYIEANKFPQAEDALLKAEKINKNYSGIYMVRGNMAMKEGKREQAYSWYEQAIYFNPNDKVAYLKLAEAYKDANAQAALDYLNRLVAIDPNYIPAYALIGDINRESGMYYQALDAYEKFISIEGVPVLQHDRYAQLLYFTDQYQKSLEQINYVLKQNPANPVMLRLKGYNYFKLGDMASAAREMDEFLKNNPEDKHIYLDYITYGQALVKEKKAQVAIPALRRAIVLDPAKAGEVYKTMLSAYEELKDEQGIINTYEKYFEVTDTHSTVDYFNYGLTLYNAASQYIDESYLATLTPEQRQAGNTLFSDYINKGNFAFGKLVELNPQSHMGYLWRGNINFLVDYKERNTKNAPFRGVAIPYYEEALKVMLENNADGKRNKDIIDVYDYFASYYLLRDDNVNAGEYYKKILGIDPENQKATTALKQLKIKY